VPSLGDSPQKASINTEPSGAAWRWGGEAVKSWELCVDPKDQRGGHSGSEQQLVLPFGDTKTQEGSLSASWVAGELSQPWCADTLVPAGGSVASGTRLVPPGLELVGWGP
jgi:hypothetical protein